MSLPLPFTKHFAELTVLRAALLTRRVISAVTEISKHDATPVTMADFGAQALIMAARQQDPRTPVTQSLRRPVPDQSIANDYRRLARLHLRPRSCVVANLGQHHPTGRKG